MKLANYYIETWHFILAKVSYNYSIVRRLSLKSIKANIQFNENGNYSCQKAPRSLICSCTSKLWLSEA